VTLERDATHALVAIKLQGSVSQSGSTLSKIISSRTRRTTSLPGLRAIVPRRGGAGTPTHRGASARLPPSMPTTPSGDRGTLCRRRARVELLNDPCGFPELRDDRVALVPLDDTLELGVVVDPASPGSEPASSELHRIRRSRARAPSLVMPSDRAAGRRGSLVFSWLPAAR
jgi:hypothetical protein